MPSMIFVFFISIIFAPIDCVFVVCIAVLICVALTCSFSVLLCIDRYVFSKGAGAPSRYYSLYISRTSGIPVFYYRIQGSTVQRRLIFNVCFKSMEWCWLFVCVDLECIYWNWLHPLISNAFAGF